MRLRLAYIPALIHVVLPVPVFGAEHDTALLRAVETVESHGDPNAVGDNGRAVGILQLHPSYVAEANRLRPRGTPKFTLADRRDRAKSETMFWIVSDHYGGNREERARRHNGGPTGQRKASTVQYWSKVQDALYKPLGPVYGTERIWYAP